MYICINICGYGAAPTPGADGSAHALEAVRGDAKGAVPYILGGLDRSINPRGALVSLEETMPTLFVSCKECQTEFPTPIGGRETGKSGVIISSLRLRCPKCGRESEYSTPDFHITAGTPAQGGTAEADPSASHAAHEQVERQKVAAFGVVDAGGGTPHQGRKTRLGCLDQARSAPERLSVCLRRPRESAFEASRDRASPRRSLGWHRIRHRLR